MEKEIEIKLEISKKAGLLRKPVKFVDVPGRIDESIPPNEKLWMEYIDRNPVINFIYRKSSIRSRPCIILNPKFPRLVLEVLQKVKFLEQHCLHSVPSYKERSYKEQLVEILGGKEQRLVDFKQLRNALCNYMYLFLV